MTEGDTQAEHEYRHRMEYMPFRYALIFYVCVAAIVTGLLAWQWDLNQDQQDFTAQVCYDSAINREAIRDSLKRSFTNLGYRWDEKEQDAVFVGPPSLAYWSEHPGEIPSQLERLRQELDGFPRIVCR